MATSDQRPLVVNVPCLFAPMLCQQCYSEEKSKGPTSSTTEQEDTAV